VVERTTTEKIFVEAQKIETKDERPRIMNFQMSTMTNGRPAPTVASTSSTRAWSVQDASELYEVPRWGHGYFSVNVAGHVQVHPTKEPARAIDLK
jgi:arginine decarboxylase-like protein